MLLNLEPNLLVALRYWVSACYEIFFLPLEHSACLGASEQRQPGTVHLTTGTSTLRSVPGASRGLWGQVLVVRVVLMALCPCSLLQAPVRLWL